MGRQTFNAPPAVPRRLQLDHEGFSTADISRRHDSDDGSYVIEVKLLIRSDSGCCIAQSAMMHCHFTSYRPLEHAIGDALSPEIWLIYILLLREKWSARNGQSRW